MLFPVLTKSRHYCLCFINNYLPTHMCPRFILSDNRMKFKIQLMEDVLKQLGIGHIFSTPHHSQSNGKLEAFHKYLKPKFKKLCENEQDNLDQYTNQVLASYHIIPHLTTAKTPFFLIYRRAHNLPLHQLLELMQ